MTQKFDFSLTDNDIDLTRLFMMAAADAQAEYVSSDRFREWGLADGFEHPETQIGGFFAKLKANGVLVAVGEEPSVIEGNNRRRVDLFRFDWARWRSIIRSRLP